MIGIVATDYAHVAAFLDRSRLPAYVSFVERASARGIAGATSDDQRISVRMSDGKIVSGTPPADSQVARTTNGESDDPFRDGGLFDPHCYVPKSEVETRWNGQPALRFDLQATCASGNGITELYANPETFRPLAADGNIADPDDQISVAIELRYATIGGYSVPSSIRAHAVGHGWLFWARERVELDYVDYQFYNDVDFAHKTRQAKAI